MSAAYLEKRVATRLRIDARAVASLVVVAASCTQFCLLASISFAEVTRRSLSWDFAVYYRGEIDPQPFEELGWPGQVFRPFEWGQVMYGGLGGAVGEGVEGRGLQAVDRADIDHPRRALVAGPSGLEDVERVVRGAGPWLARRAAVVVEIAPHQARAAQECARGAGFDDVEVLPDLAGRERVLVARR